ncbi:MAG: glycosyltransferase, partial [Alphaproteobacteria bacterium]|nr:glycosyltransferase [Alphaproteobacteria bacterium]
GAKFTMALGSALSGLDGRALHLSAADHSDLALDLARSGSHPYTPVSIFTGDKQTLSGRISAACALLKLPRIGFDFKNALDQFKPDLALCSFQSIWDLAALPVLKHSACPFVLCLHDAEPHPGDRYPLRAKAMAWQVNTSDALIVMSDHVHYPKERIFKIPHGRFDFSDAENDARFFPEARPFRLLFLGRITEYKGLPLLLEAYRTLLASQRAFTLTIAGSGDLGAAHAMIEHLPNIELVNEWLSDDEIAHYLKNADAVVLPYIEASQSGVAAAAFSAGLPVIATPIGGLKEQIAHGVTGLIAKEVSANAFADTLLELATTPALYEALSHGALTHASTTLDWKNIGITLASALDNIMKMPKRQAVQ